MVQRHLDPLYAQEKRQQRKGRTGWIVNGCDPALAASSSFSPKLDFISLGPDSFPSPARQISP